MAIRRVGCFIVGCCLLCLPTGAWAQSSVGGIIAGVVRDTTGAVLPGVTVEATSPALIEKVRIALTDAEGQYKIVDLRPGTYTVTFTLASFSTVKREGIQLTTGFTATANAELRVGSLEETVTVTGGSPVVDIQNVRQQNVLTREILDAIPARTSTQALAALTLGASVPANRQDVGGSSGEFTAGAAIHGVGGNESTTNFDGTSAQLLLNTGGGGVRWFKLNQVMAEEITLQTGGVSADSESGGFSQNVVPKDGGNTFRLYSMGNYTGKGLQSTNVTDALRARGLTATPAEEKIYDVGAGLGGPIKKDDLWFYTGHRRWGTDERQPGNFANLTPHTLFYTPDKSKPAVTQSWTQDHSLRLTWQAAPKHKLSFTNSYQRACACLFGVAGTARAGDAGTDLHYTVNFAQAAWTYPVTSRLLIEAGVADNYSYSKSYVTNGTQDDIAVTELSSGVSYGSYTSALNGASAYTEPGPPNYSVALTSRYAVSYVTGSHALKVGLTTLSGKQTLAGQVTKPSYSFRNQLPSSLTLWASPSWNESHIKMKLGLYAQDQWTLKRLTLNYGLRLDQLNAYNPAQVRPGGEWVAPLNVARQDDVPNWKDISPRFGAAYDLFGTGKTALKASVGRYVILEATTIAARANPSNAIVTTTDRTWNDSFFPVGDPRRGNFVPDCDLHNPVTNDECGPFSSSTFGTVNITTRYADSVRMGTEVRPFNWQTNVSLQQELWSGVALNIGYYRTGTGNFFVTNNVATPPSSYSPYCITLPVDPRLPGGGGSQMCGFSDVSVAAFGSVSNVITSAASLGTQTLRFDGVDVALNARFGRGGAVSAGLSTGQTVADACGIATSHPEVTATMALTNGNVTTGPSASTNFCRVTLPYEGQTQIKFAGAYPLPWWGVQAAATYQNLPGLPVLASYVATNAQIAPSLGRNLSACGASATCPTASVTIANIIEPNTIFEDRFNQVDIRLSKKIGFGRARLTGMFDIYNLLNASPITAYNSRYGAVWLTPVSILPARLFKFGAQIDF